MTEAMTVHELLVAARELLADPENHIAGKNMDCQGRVCAVGAVRRAAGVRPAPDHHAAMEALRQAVGRPGGILFLNETGSSTDDNGIYRPSPEARAAVLAAYDRAIEATRTEDAE